MTEVPDSTFDLVVGQPSAALMPRLLLDEYIRRTVIENVDPFIYQYPTAHGSLPMRVALVEFLTKSHMYGSNVSPHNLMITQGNSQGLALAISMLSSPDNSVIVEEPTYFLSGQILCDSHLHVHPCPIRDADGMDMDAFENLVVQYSPKLVYMNPIHQNPTGTCLSVARRERLLQLAHKHGFIILSDEPYVLLTFSKENPLREMYCSLSVTAERMYGPKGSPYLACFGTFSKILTPGLRCGWIHASEDIIERISRNGALISGGGPPSLITDTIHKMIVHGALTDNINFLRTELAKRCISVYTAVAEYFGTIVHMHYPAGGYFLYVIFGGSFDSVAFMEFLRSQNFPVRFLPASKCSAASTTIPAIHTRSCIRIAFSFYTPCELREAVRLLREGYDAYIGQCTVSKESK